MFSSCYSGPLNPCHDQGRSSINEACTSPRFAYPWRISNYRNVTTVLYTPWTPWYPIVVRIENHRAFSLSCFCATNAMGVETVTEVFLELTACFEVGRMAHTTTHWELYASPAIIASLIKAILYGTVTSNERRVLLGLSH